MSDAGKKPPHRPKIYTTPRRLSATLEESEYRALFEMACARRMSMSRVLGDLIQRAAVAVERVAEG